MTNFQARNALHFKIRSLEDALEYTRKGSERQVIWNNLPNLRAELERLEAQGE